MTNIAILGFGVVGGGVADLLTRNKKECEALGKDSINIKYILDLRDFPESPFADRVVHDYNIILADSEVSVVIETMGGSHPAYEFTVSALKAGKSVITSNKEVVANFGEEFLALAEEHGVSYRFEASVGGGIPVISPLIHSIGQNKLCEVRGIQNGTTNYILTQMFTFGKSFETALAEAQAQGYAERNPDADILGTDACRKIAILTALATGKLISTDRIHTEGITAVRSADVSCAAKLGCTVKLVGRCIADGDMPYVMVAPFLVPRESALSGVSGVYNAVEVVAEPLGNVMFYGRGAGAGATASAVVGDLMETMRLGGSGMPAFERCDAIRELSTLASRHYLAFCAEERARVLAVFGSSVTQIDSPECAILTEELTEAELAEKLSDLTPISHIRLLA